jgi:Na+-transporting NADH:ubiquinone oxidoreductase subunit C
MFILSALFAGAVSAINVATADKVIDNQKIAASKNLVQVFELMEITPETTGEQLARALRDNIQKLWIIEKDGQPAIVSNKPAPTTNVFYQFWAMRNLVDGKSQKPVAFAFPIGGKGFWGPIKGIISVEPDGETIRTVVWTHHTETPGLGARIEEDPYREKFRGKIADPAKFQMVPENTMGDDPYKMDQITGATQTTQVGMGQFLPENFDQWKTYFPMLKEHFVKASK